MPIDSTRKLLYATAACFFLAGCNSPRVEAPNQWDNNGQKVYAHVCTGCHDVPTYPKEISNGKLSKSKKDVTVGNVVSILTTPGSHKIYYKDVLSDQEINEAASYFVNDRLRSR